MLLPACACRLIGNLADIVEVSGPWLGAWRVDISRLVCVSGLLVCNLYDVARELDQACHLDETCHLDLDLAERSTGGGGD